MPLGPAIRHLLGPQWARRVGRWYRGIFVDLDKVATVLATAIPRDAHLLDVGGGDGEPLNHLLAARRDLRVTTLDPSWLAGQWIEERFSGRVAKLPGTSLADYIAAGRPDPDAILLADVFHHIPESTRQSFLQTVRLLLDRAPHLRIIVKDVEPGCWRALLGYWSDRYITGDRHVSPISRECLVRLLEDGLGPLRHEDTDLFDVDRPNYAIVFFR